MILVYDLNNKIIFWFYKSNYSPILKDKMYYFYCIWSVIAKKQTHQFYKKLNDTKNLVRSFNRAENKKFNKSIQNKFSIKKIELNKNQSKPKCAIIKI